MKLYAFNPALERVGILTRYNSLRWLRSFAGLGEIEFHAPIKYAPLLVKGNLLWRNDGDEAALITARQISRDEDGKETVMCAGTLLSGLMARRIVWAEGTHSGTAETAMRWLIDNAAITSDAARIIPNLSLGTLIGGGDAIEYQPKRGVNVADELIALAKAAGVGWYIVFDPRTPALTFKVRCGTDRTVGQSANPRAVFSHEAGTIENATLTEDAKKYANVALVVGGPDDAQVTATVGTATGVDRREIYVESKAKNALKFGDTVVTIAPELFAGMITVDGNKELAERPNIVSMDATLTPNESLVYKRDFDLGDLVTIKSKRWSVQADVRITEVEEVFEPSGYKIFLTLGDPRPITR